MANDPSNPTLLRAISEMTGLRNITAEEKAAFKTRTETRAFERETGRLTEYSDLWGIVMAALLILSKDPLTTVLRPDDVIPHLRPMIRGDKRSKRHLAACERQMDRMRRVLEECSKEIVVERGDVLSVRLSLKDYRASRFLPACPG